MKSESKLTVYASVTDNVIRMVGFKAGSKIDTGEIYLRAYGVKGFKLSGCWVAEETLRPLKECEGLLINREILTRAALNKLTRYNNRPRYSTSEI